MIKVLPLKGFKSLWCLNAFHHLMLGLKMLPDYFEEPYESFYARIEQMPPEDQETMIREAVLFVELPKETIDAVLSFCADKHGVPFGPENIKNLGPDEIMEAIVAVCIEVSKIKVTFVSEKEKKKYKIGQSTSGTTSQKDLTPH